MKRYTLANRILAVALLLSTLLLGSWTVWTSRSMQHTLIEQKEQDVRVLLARNRDYLRLYAEGLTSGLLSLSDALAAIGDDEGAIIEALAGSKQSNPGKLLTVYCAFEDGHTLCTRAPQYEVFGNKRVEECFQNAWQSSYRGIRWTEPYFSPLSPQERTIALYRPLILNNQRAMIMMELNLSTMLSSMLRATNDASLTWAVLSAEGSLVATSDDYTSVHSDYKQISRSALEQSLPELLALPLSANKCAINDVDYLFYHEGAVSMDWSLYVFVRSSRLFAAVRPIVYTTLLIGAGHLLLLSALFTVLAARFTRPITRVAKQMEEAENPLELHFGQLPDKNDEVGILTSSLSSMIENIRSMNHEKEAILHQQRQLEIEALQAQIHPHFMGNTLACIQSLVKENKPAEAESALVSLVKLLNYSIARTDAEASLGDELRCADAYVKLRQMRKNYSFDYQVFVPEEHLSHQVPRLFLQPIIENCIEHGFPGLERRGQITVTSYEQDGKLFLCVDDNGFGESQQHFDAVLNGTLPPSPHSHGIGVRNVFKRLQLTRPEATGCTIKSRPSGGVRVILDLGKRQANHP